VQMISDQELGGREPSNALAYWRSFTKNIYKNHQVLDNSSLQGGACQSLGTNG